MAKAQSEIEQPETLASEAPEATEAPEKAKRKKSDKPSLMMLTRSAFLAVMNELIDTEAINKLPADIFDLAFNAFDKIANLRKRDTVSNEVKLEAVENRIAEIYEMARKDISQLDANSEELEALFVKKRNLVYKIKKSAK